MTEQELRQLLRNSKKDAHRIIFNQYSNYVYTIVYSKLRSCASHEDIEECVSDVFAEIFMHCDTEKEGSLQGYIGIIAKRMAINRFHSLSGKTHTLISLDDENAPELSTDENIVQEAETDTPPSTSIIYQNEKGQNFTFHQQLQHNFTGLLLNDSDNHIVYMNINQNPAYYFVTGTQNEGCYLYWKQEGYLFLLETYCISVEDTLKIAESVILQNE